MRIQRPDMDFVAELSSVDEYNSLPGLISPITAEPGTEGYIVDRVAKVTSAQAVEAGYITFIEKGDFEAMYEITPTP